jgi:cell division septum initiation protein DivIVA
MTGNANRELLEAAIIGYQTKIADLQQRITEIRMRLDGHSSAANSSNHPKPAKPPKRTMSAAAKRKLSLAAKQRWAQLRRQHPKAKTLGG